LGCGPGARTFWAKGIGLSISDFELWISDFSGPLFFNPHSAIYNPQFRWPARSMKWKPPYDFCPEGPCPRAWHQTEGPLSVARLSIHFERFTFFHASGYAGGI
jgi:hypothetical protein